MTDQPKPEQPGQPEQQPSPAQFYPSAPPPPPEAPAGYPQPYQPYGQAPVPGNTNGFAIAALVLGIIPGIITNVLAVIFGLVSLNQIKQRADRGKGMAIAGIVVAGVWLALWATLIAVAINTQATRNEAGQVVDSGRLSVFKLNVGDCFDGVKEGKAITSVTAQPCDKPHEAEVMDRFPMPAAPEYPGEAKVTSDVETECSERLEGMLPPATLEKLELYYFYPTASSWRTGDRTAVCVVTGQKGTKLTEKIAKR
ncbi:MULTISPECIES: DUF4190 domain-containing protein [unclassified Crossiella]|uniref:DUF4190 domain-containing protein n=1 Tax=unclassified Crossiella TaxID=2620835 RepID=UPI001FFE79C3|nr:MULTISPECIES: DUF4190 domain-containing protein [unclassified Crossiella]MCK2239454.1 DUF4190 domain-containing protein [Crossiella sp. S99.2]MCK2252149.1 DUF4190 domain-containing protein [Crossiella sp. S99.1]